MARVWRAFCDEAMISAMNGFSEVKASKRFLAGIAGVPDDVANRAMNLLCVLGVLHKVQGSGGERGDRYVLGNPSPEEVLRRWEALGRPSPREFKKSLVEERLGPETADAVFRRAAKPVGTPKKAQVGDDALSSAEKKLEAPSPISSLVGCKTKKATALTSSPVVPTPGEVPCRPPSERPYEALGDAFLGEEP